MNFKLNYKFLKHIIVLVFILQSLSACIFTSRGPSRITYAVTANNPKTSLSDNAIGITSRILVEIGYRCNQCTLGGLYQHYGKNIPSQVSIKYDNTSKTAYLYFELFDQNIKRRQRKISRFEEKFRQYIKNKHPQYAISSYNRSKYLRNGNITLIVSSKQAKSIKKYHFLVEQMVYNAGYKKNKIQERPSSTECINKNELCGEYRYQQINSAGPRPHCSRLKITGGFGSDKKLYYSIYYEKQYYNCNAKLYKLVNRIMALTKKLYNKKSISAI